MNEQQPSYFAVIPASVRYDKSLPPAAKLLYGEITALATKEGFCWANNSYFGKLYGVHKNTAGNWINMLEKGGHIRAENARNAKNEPIRRIYIHQDPSTKLLIPPTPLNEIVDTPSTKLLIPLNEIVDTPLNEIIEHNNTSISNTNNKVKELEEANASLLVRFETLERDLEEEKKKKKTPPVARHPLFVPPTQEQVNEKFFDITGNGQADAVEFFNYYQSNGWKVGKNKMVDWASSIHQWISRHKKWDADKPPGKQSYSREQQALTTAGIINKLQNGKINLDTHKG